jgi:ribosomal protein S18 acetylase RimI-like enzyme
MSETAHGADYRLVTFHRRCLGAKEIEHVTALHTELLPRSPVVLLGRGFMQRYFYRFLPSEGYITGAIAYVDGEPAGFITATDDPSGFMRAAFRRHWLRISLLVGGAMLGNPGRLSVVIEALHINRGLIGVSRQINTGELLSMGVREEFRSGGFVERTGIRLSDDLLGTALFSLRQGGVRRVRAVVDTDNMEARLFYRVRGWTSSGAATGWRVSSVLYTLDLNGSGGDGGNREARVTVPPRNKNQEAQ